MEGVRRMRYGMLVPLIASVVALGAIPAHAQGLEGAPCVAMPLPAGLDDVDQLVDTAATVSALRAMPAGEVVLSLVGTESYGAPRLAIRAKHGGADADTVQKLVVSHLRSTDGTPAPWAVRLRATTGASGSLALAAPELCGAHPVAATGHISATVRISDEDLRDFRNAGPSTVRVWISSGGSVDRAEVIQTSGSPDRDAIDLKTARALRYEPARFEGIPIAGTYDFRVR